MTYVRISVSGLGLGEEAVVVLTYLGEEAVGFFVTPRQRNDLYIRISVSGLGLGSFMLRRRGCRI